MQTQPQISPGDWSWPFWPVVPLYPYGKRRTLRQEIVRDTIWTFDQLQGILHVVVPIRMTVVKLDRGGLLVYAPVAPTRECLRLLDELIAEHGPVRYIILPTVSGIEHKVFVGPFARHFIEAQVFVAPNQWSYPFNLPLSWLGLPIGRTHILPANSNEAPFGDEFDYETLGPIGLGLGPFVEVAFFHLRSRTLLVTDSIVSVSEAPPAIVRLDPYPLLFHARDSAFEPLEDTESSRRKGWQRVCLFAFYFRPSVVEIPRWVDTLRNAFKAADRSKRGYFGLFPFQWKPNWQHSFATLQAGGQPFVAPVLQTLILNRAPESVLSWAARVASWDFQRIVPCHFNAPIEADSAQFLRTFDFLLQPETQFEIAPPQTLLAEDLGFLKQIEETLEKRGITPPKSLPKKKT